MNNIFAGFFVISKKTFLAFILFALLLNMVFFAQNRVLAFDTSSTNFVNNNYYNALISDGSFIDINSMSVGDIQGFLAGKGSYLAQFSENGRSAAQIIWDAAHGYGAASGTANGIVINSSTGTVSPKVLLATLQKEQSLVTISYRDDNRLRAAMGYGCPDSSGCKPQYAGFTNQVENASWQFRYNYQAATNAGLVGRYTVNNVTAIDTYTVQFTNRATASLYRYTPHVFYGNYNFWRFMVDWFGVVSPPPGTPTGFNDEFPASAQTYGSNVSVTGAKVSNTRVYFQGGLVADYGSTSWKLTFSPNLGLVDYAVEYKDSNGAVVARKTITVDRHKQGDINGDGNIDLQDLSIISDNWGKSVDSNSWLVLSNDNGNTIDILSLSVIASNWGK